MSDDPIQRHDVRADRGKRNGQFITRKRKQWIDNIVSAKKARVSEIPAAEDLSDLTSRTRIVDINKLAERLWCPPCEMPLSLRFIEKEHRSGLVSVLTIRCNACQRVYNIETSRRSTKPNALRERYDLNYKIAVRRVLRKSALQIYLRTMDIFNTDDIYVPAMIDAGSGVSQINCMLSALNIPALTSQFLKRYEDEIGPAIEEIAKNSCRDGIMKERELTLRSEYTQYSGFFRITAVYDVIHHGHIDLIAN